jgi:putative oxidoreductase
MPFLEVRQAMSFGEHLAPIIGRCLIAAIFLLAGLFKIQNWVQTEMLMAQHGMQYIGLFLSAALLIEILCGFAVLIGFRTRLAAVALFGYTLAVSYVMHDFWNMDDVGLYRDQLQLFTKNMAIAGGLLLLVGNGGGGWSVDAWREE